jgi:hypothetical protein
MGKRSNLYEIYFGPVGGTGSIGDKLKNGPRGSMHSTGDPLMLDAEFEDEFELDDDFDEDDVDVLSKTGQSMSVSPVDMGRRNPQGTSYDNIGYSFGMVAGLTEKANHTTPAVQGISPNMTYRNSKGGKVSKTSASSTTYPKLYTRPYVDMKASRYGTSRAQLPRHNELDDNPIFSLNDLLDKHEVSLEKHSKNVNRIRRAINEINDNFYDI